MKITIFKSQYDRLTDLQSKMPVEDGACIRPTVAENLEEADRLLRHMKCDLCHLQGVVEAVEYAVYDRDIALATQELEKHLPMAKELREDTALLGNYLAGAVEKLLALTAPSSFAVTVPEEELKAEVDQRLEQYGSMTLVYRDGEFALLFGENEYYIQTSPYIFAKGGEQDYEEAGQYLSSLLDIEKL